MWKDKGLQLVMLPTENKVNALRGYADRSLLFRYQENYQILESEGDLTCYYYLYLLSDEEIKEGDIGFIKIGPSGTIGNVSYDKEYKTWDVTTEDNVHYPFSSKEYIHKVISATNIPPLPSLPSSFLEEYIKRYNSKKSLEVEVEYEEYGEELGCDPAYYGLPSHRVKQVNNTISIRFKEEKMYSRSEVERIVFDFQNDLMNTKRNQHLDIKPLGVAYWIKENLK